MNGLIIPLHKAGKDKAQLGSYRPVCLMSTVAKLFERLVCNRLRCHLEGTNALSPCQSGFRTGRATTDPLLRLISDVQEGLNASIPHSRTIAVLVDLSRAFDKVKHWLLLGIFKKMGIPSCYANWYRSFLMDRRYRVKYGTAKSGFCRFANGVPQGSVSGPLLFIIYIKSK